MSDKAIQVGEIDQLPDGGMRAFEHNGKRLLLVFTQGKYFVIDEMCTHEDYSLALGCIKNGQIKCSLHGSWFDLETGQPQIDPADEPICSYPVHVRDGAIWAELD